ncbi:uncharacterized protein RCO7_14176 [Rhynchosporium graminicola]|uniref:Uncharacterized protein n=1 Tax=Rhynchosporium graminicola TaxID=2792576 RepID=A0A1E1JWE3_9HELO|nr:uncharacterized protein RCO7_14176 [Rhynchosporium commune]
MAGYQRLSFSGLFEEDEPEREREQGVNFQLNDWSSAMIVIG